MGKLFEERKACSAYEQRLLLWCSSSRVRHNMPNKQATGWWRIMPAETMAASKRSRGSGRRGGEKQRGDMTYVKGAAARGGLEYRSIAFMCVIFILDIERLSR
jgi:hypothetical protein